MNNLIEVAETARSHARCNDVVQLELVGENISQHVTVSVTDESDLILKAFLDFLDELTQSNAQIASDTNLELILQVVRNPTGGTKRKASKALECELIQKKKRHLYVTDNCDNQLCFAISLAHVSDPNRTDNQALVQGREWQRLAGLTDQTPVSFSDVGKFEKILNRKIVVFHRTKDDRALCKFETDFRDRSSPLFLLLLQNHYYGKKISKVLSGQDTYVNTATPVTMSSAHITVLVTALCVTTLLVLLRTSSLCSVVIATGAVVTHCASADTKNLVRDPEPKCV